MLLWKSELLLVSKLDVDDVEGIETSKTAGTDTQSDKDLRDLE